MFWKPAMLWAHITEEEPKERHDNPSIIIIILIDPKSSGGTKHRLQPPFQNTWYNSKGQQPLTLTLGLQPQSQISAYHFAGVSCPLISPADLRNVGARRHFFTSAAHKKQRLYVPLEAIYGLLFFEKEPTGCFIQSEKKTGLCACWCSYSRSNFMW